MAAVILGDKIALSLNDLPVTEVSGAEMGAHARRHDDALSLATNKRSSAIQEVLRPSVMTMTLNAVEYEADYNDQGHHREHFDQIERREMLAMAYRLAGGTMLNQAYGSGERQRYDLFSAADKEAPLVVYIHGGYWQRGDRKDYSFVARELNANGITVAIPSYTLCPAVSVMEIGDEIQRCLAVLWDRIRKRPTVVGHSAGGHLAAEMMVRDWSGFPGVPADLVQTAYAINGIFDLAPLIGTSLNKVLSLTAGTARAASPLFRPPSPKGRRFVAAVGGEASEEVLNQGHRIAANWSAVGIDARCEVVTGADHFTIIDELITPGSSVLKQIVKIAHEANAIHAPFKSDHANAKGAPLVYDEGNMQ